MKMLCEVYRCSRKPGMYLFVDKQRGLADLPESLCAAVGTRVLAMTLVLTPDKKLARADAQQVMAAIARQGFYLQMPPATVPESI
ncbi:MAG: YcgL domain-containing protein [Cellvibrionaceae bacterium]|nr:YcgL domain-containing protein [Cellvibrionaceae bacterium]